MPYHRCVSDASRRTSGVGARDLLRWLLGGVLVVAGIGHLTAQRTEFQAQVPDWFPVDENLVVIASGLVEIALGAALIALPRHRVIVGTIVAVFFVVGLPGQHRPVGRGRRRVRARHRCQAVRPPVLPAGPGDLGALRHRRLAGDASRDVAADTRPHRWLTPVTHDVGFAELVALIADDARDRRGYVFGLAGPPGSGKSTVAAHLAGALGAVVVPMDGFHLDNTELDRLRFRDVKGAPETFDADGLRATRRTAATTPMRPVRSPRSIDSPTGRSMARSRSTRTTAS